MRSLLGLFFGLLICFFPAGVWGQGTLVSQLESRLPTSAQVRVLLEQQTATGLKASHPAGVSSSLVDPGPEVPFQSARRVVVEHATQPVWAALAASPTFHPKTTRGRFLFVSFWIRSGAQQASAEVQAYLEKAGGDYEGFASTSTEVQSTWKQVFLSFRVDKPLPPEGLHLSFHLGQRPQTIDLGGLIVVEVSGLQSLNQLPQNELTWPGKEANAPWRKVAQQRIEALRRGPLVVHVVTAKGMDIQGASVHIAQIQRSFTFGSFTGGGMLLEDNPEGVRYRSLFLQLFDRATVPLYYADWGWLKEKDRYVALAHWASDHGLAVRGHPLIYPGWQFLPAALRGDSPDALQKDFLTHIDEVASALKGVDFHELDVTNELRHLTEVPSMVGVDGVADWYREARRDFPGVKLALNENTILTQRGQADGNQATLIQWYRSLQQRGVAPNILGLQAHFDEDLTGPEDLWRILDNLSAQTNAEFQITEFDINTANEEAKAQYVRDFLTAVFAYPRVTAVTLWGFWEGDQWRPQASLWNKDWSPKPAGKVLEKLLTKTWTTNENWTTSASGVASGRVWLGKLRVTVLVHGKQVEQTVDVTDPKQGQTITVTIQDLS